MIYDAVLVGSGFSAIATLCNLIERLPASAAVAVIGDDPGFGRGTAYRSELYLHRLNVPAGRMSLFPDRPDGFVEWLAERKRPLKEGDFASRQDYGLYVRDSLAALLRNKKQRCRVDFIRAKATGCVERYNETLGFLLDNGGEIAGRNVVLCLGVGNAPLPVDVSGLAASAKERIIENPWRLSWLRRVGREDVVCILGSGLTMIDQVLALQARGFRGKIDVLSRRGLVPHGHVVAPKPPADFDPQTLPVKMSALLHRLREESRVTGDWRSVMDRLRPQTQALWARLPAAERSRFLRHALPWWNIHRHRVAPDVHGRFRELVENGQVVVHAGFLSAVEEAGKGLSINYRAKGTWDGKRMNVDWLINCTGVERAGIAHSPLLAEMKRQALIKADPRGLGIVVDPQSRVPGDTAIRARLYAVGALTAGQFWEITAVPDIRVQAQAVANEIASVITARE
ncbi:FAD/NAD(P)-binding protein [Rhizobium sp. BG4]|uniref:FAD/NAD(P)-binding protein n=1 Tax=Rhizobium sp. BG4 TaxID=2613770 RepID=UPI00193DC1F7|nr:FAD/NAD(P)-binding protein [Rhizobium sp. BG4]QRM47257.1 FAD-dependent pyridine nucleotide-disulfide oxidoreductase [Rhizobium sp. BG4]